MNAVTMSNTAENYESGKLAAALYPAAMRKEADGTTSYYARPLFRKRLTMENIASDIIALGLLRDCSKEQILTAWNVINNAVLDRVMNGLVVDTGLGTFSARIAGSFDSKFATFDHEKHAIELAFHQSGKTKETLKDLEPVISQGNNVSPEILEIFDLKSHSGETLTPGGFLEIRGKNLLVTGSNALVGLYFVNEEDATKSVKLSEEELGKNCNASLACVVPQLVAGSYRLKVVTQCRKYNPKKEPEESISEKSFTVQ